MMPHFVLSHAELISAQARKKGVATEGDRGFSEWALAGRGIKEPLGGTDDRPSQQWGWWVVVDPYILRFGAVFGLHFKKGFMQL